MLHRGRGCPLLYSFDPATKFIFLQLGYLYMEKNH